jgi:hypothetical protein
MRATLQSIGLCIGLGTIGLIPAAFGTFLSALLIGAGHGTDLPARMLAGPYGIGIGVCALAASLGGLPWRLRIASWCGSALLAITHIALAYRVYSTVPSADIGYFESTMQSWFAVLWFGLAWMIVLAPCAIGVAIQAFLAHLNGTPSPR